MIDNEKLVELLNNSFAEQYEKRGLLTAPHTATDLIAHGVTVQEWISVKDRLPEEMRAVIVWTKDRAMGEAWLAEDGFEWCESGERADITHWMPMPQPPKGD